MLACVKISQAVLQWHQPVELLAVPNISSSNSAVSGLEMTKDFALGVRTLKAICFKCSGNALAPCTRTGRWSWEAALKDAGQGCLQHFRRGGNSKKQNWHFSDSFTKEEGQEVNLHSWFMRFSSSPRQFVLLKTTINNAGQNLAAKSNRKLSSSYNETFKKQKKAKH